MMNKVKNWLDTMVQACKEPELNYIDIIADQCGMELELIPALNSFSPALNWQSLFQGLPEEIHSELAPLLVRINLADGQQMDWLAELARVAAPTAPLLALGSSWPFSELATWLTHCMDAKHEGRSGLLRYWDTRIFPYLFSAVLDAEQQQQLLKPAFFWSWLDSDSQQCWQLGSGAAYEENVPFPTTIELSDHQLERLICLSDAHQLLEREDVALSLFSPTGSKAQACDVCFNGMLLATEQGILLDEQREAWVLEHLATPPGGCLKG